MTEVGNQVARDISMLDADFNVDDQWDDGQASQLNQGYYPDADSVKVARGDNINSESNNEQGPIFSSISSLPSFGSPLSTENAGLPIASSTPRKLFTARFNTSPRFGLGINSFKPPAAGFHFTSSEFFGSLNLSPVTSPSHSPELNAVLGKENGVEEKSFSLGEKKGNEEEYSDGGRASFNLDDAQRDAERVARLTSEPAPALSSPKSAEPSLPSYLQPRTQSNRSKSESLTSPSQSPTPSSAPASRSSFFPNLRAISPDTESRLLKSSRLEAPFSPIHRHFTRPGDSDDEISKNTADSADEEVPAVSVEGVNTQEILHHDGLTSGSPEMSPTNPFNQRSVTPELPGPIPQPIASTILDSDKLRSQSVSPSIRFTSSIRRRGQQRQSEQNKPPSPRKLLRELSRCISSPPNVSSVDDETQPTRLRGSSPRRWHVEDVNSLNSTESSRRQSRPVKGTDLHLKTGGRKQSTASDVLKLLENLNASMRMTRQEIEYLHNRVRSEFPESAEAEGLSSFETESAGRFRQDMEQLDRMWTVDWRLHSYVQITLGLIILVVVAVLLFFGAAFAHYIFKRALLPRPYVGPEIALGRRC
ncbi:hypothetical protein V1517DRAFT_326356 [Lipomyces orientalis]|uniref:Uncharacterized protein n=1 Tax=Lipomyces orientalis TaxID=1233043 RepID=A0ACC3TJY7_9ASCO